MNMSEPSWDFYRTFLTVLQTGSLSAAARELGLTQPTVGRHIDALEDHFRAPLFVRSQQGLMPTEFAADLRPYAETLFSTTSALLRAASGERGRVAGTVRISASDVIGIEVLPPILARLQDDHPDLVIELSLSDRVEDLLRREADVAVRMTAPAQEALLVRHIGSIDLGLYAHETYLRRHGRPETLEALKQHRLIGFDREKAYIRAMLRHLPMLAENRFAMRADSNLAQIAAIRAGGGIGVCQVLLARRDAGMVRLFENDIALGLETYVTMHENLRNAARYRVTFDALAKGLRDYIGRGPADPEA
ncbi:LysR family transcriptional regulator [Rhizobium sp. LjRoot30]|uniref:LysR family transcriptional regulator n=1 Tax=Rhizobium sp. LjRoot30 TaxID=3342320 RepID=UPI003ED0AB1B